MFKYFLIFLFPIVGFTTEIDLSGIDFKKAKEDTEKVKPKDSVFVKVGTKYVEDLIEYNKTHPNNTSSYSQNNNKTTKPSNQGASSAYVTGIEKDGNFTVVKCSKGKDTRIIEKYGKCTDNFNMGSYGCSSVMKWAKERCSKR